MWPMVAGRRCYTAEELGCSWVSRGSRETREAEKGRRESWAEEEVGWVDLFIGQSDG